MKIELKLKNKKRFNSNNIEFGYNIDAGGKIPAVPKLWQYDYIYQYRCRFGVIKLIVEKNEFEKVNKQIDNPWDKDLILIKIQRVKIND